MDEPRVYRPNAVTPVSAPPNPINPNTTQVHDTGVFNNFSTPTDAEVYIDNRFKGYTPATLEGITQGDLQVLLKYTNYIDYSTTIASVTAGHVPRWL